MTLHYCRTCGLLAFLAFYSAFVSVELRAKDTAILPVEQVRPGMRGVGRTVFSGDQIEEFPLEVVDVLRNYYPGQDVVLVRLLGPRAEKIGVAAGMSGSPVYIEGKLLGAIAYRFGVFSKDPLAGVMPIEQMLPILRKQEQRNLLWKPRRNLSEQFLKACMTGKASTALLLPEANSTTQATSLSPWPKLLILAGFQQQVIDWANAMLAKCGFVVVGGGGNAALDRHNSGPGDLQPGSPVALVLVDGDASIEVVGTVTWRQGNHLLAFGHPVFDAGPISFPMGRVRIAATIPSLYSSEKIPVLYDLVGTFHQDRLTGAFGEVGPLPDLTPVVVRCRGADASEREFRFRAALDPSLRTMVPFYLRTALINAIESCRLSGGDYSLRVRSTLRLNGNQKVELDNFYARREAAGFFSPMEDALRSTMDVATAIASLMFNPFQEVHFDSLTLDVQILPRSRHAEIVRVWYDRAEVRPGDSLTVVCTLLTSDGRWQTVRRSFQLPASLPERGRINIIVAGASELSKWELRNFPHRFRPLSFKQMLNILNSKRRNDRLYIVVSVSDLGLAVGSKELPALPPSLLAILGNPLGSGDVKTLRTKVVLEDNVPLGYEVTGSKTVTVSVETKANGKTHGW